VVAPAIMPRKSFPNFLLNSSRQPAADIDTGGVPSPICQDLTRSTLPSLQLLERPKPLESLQRLPAACACSTPAGPGRRSWPGALGSRPRPA